MIRDARLTFSQTTSPLPLNTGAAGDYQIGDIIDLTATGRDIGAGEGVGDLFLFIEVAVAVTGGSFQLSLATSDSATLASPTKIQPSAVFASPTAVGTVIMAFRLVPAVYKRYIGLVQTTSGSAITSGAVYAFFAEDVNAIRYYPQAFS